MDRPRITSRHRSGPRLSGAVWATIILAASSGASLCAENADEILAILKARDTQFDNVQLTYTMVGTNRVMDDSWKTLSLQGQAPVEPSKKPQFEDFPFRHMDQMTIRGAEVTFHRIPDPQMISEQNPTKSMTWNNIGGVRTELVVYDSRYSSEATLSYQRHLGAVADGEAEHRMLVEFALGIGFGKRLEKVESVERMDNNGLALRGVIKLWIKDVSRCILELDQDYVGRKAIIDCDVDGNLTHIEVNTNETKQVDGFPVVFGGSGHYLRRWDGRIINGKLTGTPRVMHEYDVLFEKLRFGLTDEEYRKATTIEVPPGTMVVDPDGIAAARRPKVESKRRLLIIALLNAIGVSVILVILWLRAMRRRRQIQS